VTFFEFNGKVALITKELSALKRPKTKKVTRSERSEASAFYLFENKQMQIPRFARNDRAWRFFHAF
jgi:hypothetical protein